MKKNKGTEPKKFSTGRWSGILTSLLILFLIVIALVIVVIWLPITDPTTVLETAITPSIGSTSSLLPVPPKVDTSGIVVMGGLMVLLVLGLVTRELLRHIKTT